MNYGFHGKILYVDLGNASFKEVSPHKNDYRRTAAGSIFAVTKLLKETQQGLDAFDPKCYLIFSSGILGGHQAPGLARFTIVGKSPATGGIGEARCEGPFAHALKKTGYDAIIIHGKAEKPLFLSIEDGQPRLESAENLWGKKVSDTVNYFKEQYRSEDISTAIIGPAGENLIRFANVICDQNHQASRAGMGAVMGSKNFKGILIKGGKLPVIADPERLKQISKDFNEQMHKNTLSMWQHDRPGFGAWIHTHGTDAALGVNNYQTSHCEYTDNYTPERFSDFYVGESPCPYCPNNCIKRYASNSTEAKSGGLHQEALGSLGPNLGNSDLKKIIDTNVLCNEYGLDPNSLGFTISFAQECIDKGLIKSDELDYSFSKDIDLIGITQQIVERKGLGNILAEGAAKAAKIIGKGSEKFALTIKGNEIVSTECRSQTNLALGYAVAACGPRYDICEHDWDFDIDVGWDHTLNYCRTIGILDRIPMQYLGKDKVKNFKALNNLWSAIDALGMCIFASAPTRVYSMTQMAELFEAITGYESSSYELMRYGELKNHLYRLYNYREGFTSEDDTLPERFFEQSIDSGKFINTKINYDKFRQMLDFYYEMMGWDQSGKPREATLYDYGANELL